MQMRLLVFSVDRRSWRTPFKPVFGVIPAVFAMTLAACYIKYQRVSPKKVKYVFHLFERTPRIQITPITSTLKHNYEGGSICRFMYISK